MLLNPRVRNCPFEWAANFSTVSTGHNEADSGWIRTEFVCERKGLYEYIDTMESTPRDGADVLTVGLDP